MPDSSPIHMFLFRGRSWQRGCHHPCWIYLVSDGYSHPYSVWEQTLPEAFPATSAVNIGLLRDYLPGVGRAALYEHLARQRVVTEYWFIKNYNGDVDSFHRDSNWEDEAEFLFRRCSTITEPADWWRSSMNGAGVFLFAPRWARNISRGSVPRGPATVLDGPAYRERAAFVDLMQSAHLR